MSVEHTTTSDVRDRLESWNDPAMLIGPMFDEALRSRESDTTERRPLDGLSFVVKDNIDVGGVLTTAGCPTFDRLPQTSATAVELLLAAGADVVGKANLDQFATGLNGTRSPYGTPRNPLDPELIPGGSSSGSATAVAAGVVEFSLGTDTAGSGRVPSAMTQIVAVKPTPGLISTEGIVPACASLDCVSIHARSVVTAARVFDVLRPNSQPPDSSQRTDRLLASVISTGRLRVGVPNERVLATVAPAIRASYSSTLAHLASTGATIIEIPFDELFEVGAMLYDGPFVAERTAAVGSFIDRHPTDVDPVVRAIIQGGRSWSAVDYHAAVVEVRERAARIRRMWAKVDVIAHPSIVLAPTVTAMLADPTGLNSRLSRFTDFTNLLGFAAITVRDPFGAVPGGGLTLQGPALSDRTLLTAAATLLGEELPEGDVSGEEFGGSGPPREAETEIVVAGAHLRGEALNHQLLELDGRFVSATTTSSEYRFWLLPDGKRPALEHVGSSGSFIDVEVWAVPSRNVGGFLAQIARPLGLGRIAIADGEERIGFICEQGALDDAIDITGHGGWKSWRAAQKNGTTNP